MELIQTLKKYWSQLYPNLSDDLLKGFLAEIESAKNKINFLSHEDQWYKDAVVYSLYVDAFNADFNGLIQKLDYLQDLGVNCLWLLPILDSPMKDAGFDIRNYDRIRTDLLGLPEDSSLEAQQQIFKDFLEEAHHRGIKVIFDIAINHTSEEHPWFIESRKSEDNPYRDYYIWSKDTSMYEDARIIFKGLCDSNWESDGEWNYFHRFFEFQPDLNFRNPNVLLDMTRNFLFWLTQGVDGFRADAIPYIWKEDGTSCENHPMTHTVVKFFRAVLDYIRPHTLLLAEACQKPKEVIKYFGDGDECNAGYHFPLMPQIFKSLASGNKSPVESILSKEVTPDIPDSAQWFTFLRCHDELSLELVYVSEEDRKFIHENYCHEPLWNFRLGQGVASRLSELFKRNPDRIGLAYSVMLSLPGTPIIYYGDEFGKLNNEQYYNEQIKLTGKDDTRFLVRGDIDWQKVETELENKNSLSSKVFNRVKNLVNTRNKYNVFGRGEINWTNVFNQEGDVENRVLAYIRSFENDRVFVLNNLSEKSLWVHSELLSNDKIDILGQEIKYGKEEGHIELEPYQYCWIEV